MNPTTERHDILTAAAEQRRRDVMHYQINIDNFRAAIAEIEAHHADDANLLAFRDHLAGLLASSLAEQAKERIMLTVIERQLQE